MCATPRRHCGLIWAFFGHWQASGRASIETLPDGCAQFTVELTRQDAPKVFLSGPRRGPGHYAKLAGTAVIGVRLRPGVGYLLRGRPMCELVDRRERCRAPALVQQMAWADSMDACLQVLERWLAGMLADAALDARVSAAIRVTAESSGDARIEEVAVRCGVGRRQLERLMRVWVGVSPKCLARVARFQALLGNVTDASPKDWTRMAAESYADQSHLIHEFTEFAGASPRRFYAGRSADSSAARCG